MKNRNFKGKSPPEKLYGKFKKRRWPFQGTMELTRHCNLNCAYCYVGFDHDIAPGEEINQKQACSLIDQVAEEGCLYLIFTGGEPLCRDDFIPIYLQAVRRGIIIIVFTNGTRINQEILSCFKEYPPLYLEIPLPGVTAETYEGVTGVKGSFRECMSGIRLLKENQIPLKLKSVFSQLNRHEAGAIRRFARELGVEFRYDAMICPRLDGSRAPCRYRLSPEEIVALDQADGQVWEELIEFSCQAREPLSSDRLYICGAGWQSFHITSTGRLTPCVLTADHSYDLIKGSFREGWQVFLAGVREKKISRHFECLDCDLRALCANCPAWSTLETGSPENVVKFRCQVAHLRAELLQKSR